MMLRRDTPMVCLLGAVLMLSCGDGDGNDSSGTGGVGGNADGAIMSITDGGTMPVGDTALSADTGDADAAG